MKNAGQNRVKRGKKSRKERGRRKLFPYLMETIVIAVVVAAAISLPQIIFQVQDKLLCGGTTLGQRESMNVESLSTTYEISLGKRMQKFAEGLAENEKYYVTSQELTVDDTLTEYLYSEKGLYWNVIIRFVEDYLLPPHLWDGTGYGYFVSQWKQYVIYNDNYEEGVNFILWYIEMQDAEGAVLKLLADAEDNTVYGMKAEGSSKEGSHFGYDYLRNAIRDGEGAMEAWTYLAIYYGAMSDELTDTLSLAEKMGVDIKVASTENDTTVVEVSAIDSQLTHFDEGDMEIQLRKLFKYKLETKGRTCFFLPFGNAELDAVVDIEDQDFQKEILFPNVTIGIRQIYELIPEFA